MYLIFVSCLAEHPWVREDGTAPDVAIDTTVLKRLKEFSAMNRLKKAALKVTAP